MSAPQVEDAGTPSGVSVLINQPVLAAIATSAALSVPGVHRMEPGLRGLATAVARMARQRIRDLEPAPTEGVRVLTDEAGAVDLELDIVITGQDQAASVAQTVQRTVAARLAAAAGITPRTVAVTILDIEPVNGP